MISESAAGNGSAAGGAGEIGHILVPDVRGQWIDRYQVQIVEVDRRLAIDTAGEIVLWTRDVPPTAAGSGRPREPTPPRAGKTGAAATVRRVDHSPRT
jgi:hypothetical protein